MNPVSARGPEQELEEMHRQLAEAYQLASLGRLVAGVIHEINTPIGSIVSNNEVITRSLERLRAGLESAQAAGEPPPSKLVGLLDALKPLLAVDKLACERILSVVRSLKTCARADGDDLRRVSLNDLVDGAVKLAHFQYRREITLETNLGEIPEVECYPHLLSQVFLNLIVNAAQSIPTECRVLVSTRMAAGMVEIEVSDTGQGIPPDQQARIFQRGFTTKPVGVGTGLGLALSRDIVVDRHQGVIEFESEPGQGTTFRIRIPISPPAK